MRTDPDVGLFPDLTVGPTPFRTLVQPDAAPPDQARGDDGGSVLLGPGPGVPPGERARRGVRGHADGVRGLPRVPGRGVPETADGPVTTGGRPVTVTPSGLVVPSATVVSPGPVEPLGAAGTPVPAGTDGPSAGTPGPSPARARRR